MNVIDKLIQEVSFPRAGEFYSVVCTGWHDNSYKTDIFKCVASDAQRVVGVRVTSSCFGDKPLILYRGDWRFDDVSALLPALGIGVEDSAQVGGEAA